MIGSLMTIAEIHGLQSMSSDSTLLCNSITPRGCTALHSPAASAKVFAVLYQWHALVLELSLHTCINTCSNSNSTPVPHNVKQVKNKHTETATSPSCHAEQQEDTDTSFTAAHGDFMNGFVRTGAIVQSLVTCCKAHSRQNAMRYGICTRCVGSKYLLSSVLPAAGGSTAKHISCRRSPEAALSWPLLLP